MFTKKLLMNTHNNKSTAREALIAEAIGDIGVVLEQIEELKEFANKFIILLKENQKEALILAENDTIKHQVELQCYAKKEKLEFEKKLEESIKKAISQLENAGKRMADNLDRPTGLPLFAQVLIAFTIAASASLLTIYGSYKMFGKEQDQQAAIGRAVMLVWEDLDNYTKNKIESGL